MTLSKKIIFRSQQEAEARTGYFSVSTLLVSCDLGAKIQSYISSNSLSTYFQSNQRKTCYNTYTLHFTLKKYHTPTPKIYLAKPGATGSYSHLSSATHPLNVKKLKDLEARSPTLEQMYFWIAQKYPDDLLRMEFETEPINVQWARLQEGRGKP